MAAVIQQPIKTIENSYSKERYVFVLPQQKSSIKDVKEQKDDDSTGFGIDPRDVGTPDNWIPRHPELIRLTGKHPFNCEPPLPSLMKEGFLTPTPLHYVRNHGAVPKLGWNTHRLVVNGLVSNPLNLSMDDIVKMPYREFPVTLVCAGNRRKEQNMVKQSIGFHWGPSAVSTAIWRGVPLRYILKMAGCSLDADYDEPRHVCFVGADKLPNDVYGTSLTLEWSMNDARDVLVAYEMNGERLTPDHGYPVRIIIPGVIGGRMIKWLTEITVTNKESDNYYHYHDNRVLPPNVDAELANKERWWYVPDYIINELNINSAISSPGHDENIPISSFVSDSEYTLKGYAYSGGGRKVIRVEISFDNGKKWLLTNLEHPEIDHPLVLKRPHNPIRKYWCWCFWSLKVPLYYFIGCSEVRVRAVDAAQNTQPENLTWNVMGMMNNCHYRVKIHTVVKEREVSLRFEHPTQAGNNPGGWMVKKESDTVSKTTTKPTPTVKNETSKKLITIEEVKKHDNEADCWIVVDKKVYDCTKFLDDHPGGADSILINAGTDCTEEFDAIHSDKAKEMLTKYYIGDLKDSDLSTKSNSSITIPKSITLKSDEDSLKILNPKAWVSCPLIEKKIINHNTRIFRFALQSNKQSLGLPVGKHIYIRSSVNNKAIIRPYTPITPSQLTTGYFDLLIKVYFKNMNTQFPNGGIMSQHIESLNVGDKIDVKGPIGSFIYLGRGQYQTRGGEIHNKKCKKIGMIAGGSGITPLYQIILSVLNDPEDHTELSLIYANRTESDILLRNELDDFSKRDTRFKICYTLSKPTNDWKYESGYITEEMIRKYISTPSSSSSSSSDSENTTILLCGPPPMLNSCISSLKRVGYSDDDCHKF